ncbi:MAG: signal peptidase II [Bdellovibrionaceae bacterium]|nr:signal peptidase II [Pseudobdellovibrionaceae bacterium]
MKKRYLFLLVISGILISLDQLTKLYVHTHFRLGESWGVFPSFFNITYVRNYGAAFGFLAESHPTFREVFFLAMPPIALAIIIAILRTVKDDDWRQIVSLSLIFGGAIGNYIDRIRFRYVIDFLDFHLKNTYSWPAFNVADSAIVVGVGILLLTLAREGKKKV